MKNVKLENCSKAIKVQFETDKNFKCEVWQDEENDNLFTLKIIEQ